MPLSNVIPNMANATLFKVAVGDSTFTVPDTVAAPSPAGISSGLSPSTLFDSRRAVVGGYLYAAYNDGAGGTGSLDFGWRLNPKDTVVLGAIASNTSAVKVNGVTVFNITGCTTTAGVLGWYF